MGKKTRNHMIRSNPVILRLTIIFLVMTCVVGAIACYFAYGRKMEEQLSELDGQLFRVAEEYKDITENFWAIYLPVFEEPDNNAALSSYFEQEESGALPPVERFDLTRALSRMAARDEKVQWIVIYSPKREVNYIYFPVMDSMQALPEDFLYLKKLADRTKRMDIYPSRRVQIGDMDYESIAIVGGAPGNDASGSILVGYDIGGLKRLCGENGGFSSLNFNILCEDRQLFASKEEMDWTGLELEPGAEGGVYQAGGSRWYIRQLGEPLRGEEIFYAVRWAELFWSAVQSTGVILLILLCTVILAAAVYLLTLQSLTGEVNLIRNGLDILGQNRLDYRIREKFHQPEFTAIAEAVNQMAASLKENIDRAQEYERRQRDAELQELQAKFNPHFLYNTLEIFRMRCYQNGDEETADLIAQTASIFRGFIGAKTFIPIPEELAFGKRYLALFKARYGESVRVLYDIDTEVLEYGIIRNVFQPLIENYFEHGFNPANRENHILFRGRLQDEETILFTIEDNGFGMEEEAIRELNERLQRPIVSEKENYGLRNLHQRLRLFYGGRCGITLCANDGPGLVIRMVILRKTCGI